MKKLNPMVLALALAFPVAAQAQSNAELKKEIDLLKAQIAEMKQMMMAKPAAAPIAAPVAAVDPAEFNRMRVKFEALEDAHEESGFKGMKVSGFMDPVYIYNQANGRGSAQFMNSLDGSINDPSTDIYSYTTSNLGGATIKFEKDFGEGTMVVALRPRKDISGGDMFETAMLNVPLGNGLTLMAGKTPSFNGYELADAPVNKLITHNLLFDFGGPAYVTGAGLKFDLGGFAFQTMLGNLNSHHNLPGDKNAGFHWRGDYELSEFDGWAINGMHGKIYGTSYNYWDLDYWFTKGDLTMNAQIETSSHKGQAFNGGDSSHLGLSGLVAYKFTPQWEGVFRADWYDNHKNGGFGPAFFWGADDGMQGPGVGCPDDGTGMAFAASCGDYRNGFGPGVVFNDTTGLWELGDMNRGAKRTALSFGLNYTLSENTLIKFEFRHDRSDLNSFYQMSDGSYKKTNNTLGVQTVVKF
jgi:hypothetical protein